MYPIKMERDPTVIDWVARLTAFPTTHSLLSAENPYVISDGLLYTNYGSASINASLIAQVDKTASIGVHITGPLVIDASATELEYTPYQVTGSAMCEQPGTRPFLFVAESPATITSDATGDQCLTRRHIGMCMTSGLEGSTLQREVTVLVKKTTNERNLVFGIGFHTGDSATTAIASAMVTVRRLIGVSPIVIDTTKL